LSAATAWMTPPLTTPRDGLTTASKGSQLSINDS
jgi:hypothetical protein